MTSMTKSENSEMLLSSFTENFEILFYDSEFAFKADKKLITLMLASLRLEDVNCTEDSICQDGIILSGIYFIQEGKVDIHYLNDTKSFAILENGSYFGDISYIF